MLTGIFRAPWNQAKNLCHGLRTRCMSYWQQAVEGHLGAIPSVASVLRAVFFLKKKTSIGRNCGLSTHLRKEVTLIRTRWDFLCPYWFCVFQLSLTLPSWVPLGHVFEALCVVISARCHPGPGLFPFLTSSAPLGTDFGECLPLPAPLTPARICACHVISSSSFFQPSICLIFF